jgi:hypothetical protein
MIRGELSPCHFPAPGPEQGPAQFFTIAHAAADAMKNRTRLAVEQSQLWLQRGESESRSGGRPEQWTSVSSENRPRAARPLIWEYSVTGPKTNAAVATPGRLPPGPEAAARAALADSIWAIDFAKPPLRWGPG